MIKFGGIATHDLTKVRRTGGCRGEKVKRREVISSGLEPPKSICLDDLRTLLPESTKKSSLESPEAISLEKLQDLLPESAKSSLGFPPEIDLDELRQLLEPAGVVTREEVEFTTRDFLNAEASTVVADDGKPKFRAWKNVAEEPFPLRPDFTRSTKSLDIITPPLVKGKAEKASKSKSFDHIIDDSNAAKVKIVERREDADVKLDGPESFLKKLQELSEGDNLEKWIANLDLPKEMDLPQIREQIRIFLREKPWTKHRGLRFGIMDGSLAQKVWCWFKDLSIAKQILVVIGLSIVIAALGFLTAQLLQLIWPGVLGVATSGEAALREIGVEAFKTRQEPAFHLLHLHAEQAKPMSYAWANQYVLWKYCR